ncbi:amino acid permease [Dactylosporangium sp. NPDC051485]|uniref:APC family permease n=1 Tax=Dactylosporangium sp. NPDC051485 TaxID=3154846 RepID=UPI00342DBB4A
MTTITLRPSAPTPAQPTPRPPVPQPAVPVSSAPDPTTAATAPAPVRGQRIGFGPAVALYTGSLLGPGVLVLPGIAAGHAGPASLLAWVALLILSIPIAATFTALAVRYPSGSGIAAVAARAFGPDARTVVGWWFYAAVPLAASAAALLGGQYVAAALGAGPHTALAVTGVILAAVIAANTAGIRMSGRTQLAVVGVLLTLITISLAAAARHLHPDNFTPFNPHGYAAVAKATATLFVGVAGWEACATLTDAVRRPRRTLPRVTAATLLVVGVVYLGLATATIGTLGATAAQTGVPLSAVIRTGLGPAAPPIVAAVALLLTVGAANTYLAGAARSGAALAAAGDLPAWLAHQPTGVARRSLAIQAAATIALTTAAAYWHVPPGQLIRLVTVLLAAVALAGMAAAAILLPTGWYTLAAVTGTAITAAVLGTAGPNLLIPAAVAGAALVWRATRHQRTPPPLAVPAAASPNAAQTRRPRMHLPATVPRAPAGSAVVRPGRQPPNAPAPVRRKRSRRRRKRAAHQRR